MIFEVDRQEIRTTQVFDATSPPLEPGQVRLSVERFASTSNNDSGGRLRVTHRQGSAGIEATYRDLLHGNADPASGFIRIPNPASTTT